MTFTQSAACGYSENIKIVTDLPEFMTFNEETNDFTIVSDDITHDGIFALTVIGIIEVPKDYTLEENEVFFTEVNFQIEVVAECDITEFVDWSLDSASNFTINILDEEMVISVGPVEDSVSRQ